MAQESKHDRFKRLATSRGDRIIREIALLGNLSNRRNYEYTDDEVRKLFGIIEAEIKECRAKFASKSGTRKIEL